MNWKRQYVYAERDKVIGDDKRDWKRYAIANQEQLANDPSAPSVTS